MIIGWKLDGYFGNALRARLVLGIDALEARRIIDVARREVFIVMVELGSLVGLRMFASNF